MMRFTNCLILGLTLALAGGCSHCDQCRSPLFQRTANCDNGGNSVFNRVFSRPRQDIRGIVALPSCCGSVQVTQQDDCGCTTILDVQNGGEEITAITDSRDYVVPVISSESLNAPELPQVPKPPSLQPKADINSKSNAPELKGSLEPVVPVDSDSGYFIPKQPNSPDANLVVPYVVEAPPLEAGESSILNSVEISSPFKGLMSVPKSEKLDALNTNELQISSSISNPTQSDSGFDMAPSSPSQVELEPALDVQTAVPSAPPKRIKAMPISSSKVISQPVILDEVRPVPFGIIQEGQSEPVEIRREMLPAKSDDDVLHSPIVLKAFPVENHVVNDRRVADARGVDSYGLPNAERVEFRSLPSLDGQPVDETPVYYSTDEAPFEVTPIDQRIPKLESNSEIRALPNLESGNTFTTTTSYQVPMDNDAEVLTEQANAIDCGLVDHDQTFVAVGSQHQNTETEDSNQSLLRIVPPMQANNDVYYQTPDVDQVFRLGAFQELKTPATKISASQSSRIRILRMRAATPLDQQAVVPPLVSIKSVMEPVIVRHIHPDAQSFAKAGSSKAGSNKLRDQTRPVFDTERLEASIRGVLPVESGATDQQQRTIDR